MAKSYLLEIVTPFRKVFVGQVTAAVLPGEEGYFGVLPNHTPFLTGLKPGYLKLTTSDQTLHFALSGGFVEVLPNSVKVLAETAEEASEIDVQRAKEALARAERRLREGREKWDLARAQAALGRAINRLKIAEFKTS